MTDSATPTGVDDAKGKRGSFDWEAIERDYRAGVLSVREISKNYGISHVSIHKRAHKEGWHRDLTGKIKERISTALVALAVNDGHAGGNQGNDETVNQPKDKRQAESETVENAAQTVVGVIVSHRKDVNRGRQLVAMLMAQLTDAADYRETLRDLIEEETTGDRSPNRRMAMLRAVAIPAHAGTVRDLSMAMKNLVAIERQAFNIDQSPDPEPPDVTTGGVVAVTDAALVAAFVKMSELTGQPIPGAPSEPQASPEAAPDQPDATPANDQAAA